MQNAALPEVDDLADFDVRHIKLGDIEKRVYLSGEGPAVIVLTEMPGISPHVARFSRWVRDAGFRVYMPSLFGRDGVIVPAEEGAEVFRRACVSAEFRAFAGNAASPVTQWLRLLAARAHSECGGPGVGAVGMCFTGNFALSMMLESSMLAPVLCQPSLPLDEPGGLEISDVELAQVRSRLERDQLSVLAYRFEGDRFCQAARFAAYEKALGERFDGRVLPDTAAQLEGQPPFFAEHVVCPHSVVTVNLIDEVGQPTRIACDEILAFLSRRLTGREEIGG